MSVPQAIYKATHKAIYKATHKAISKSTKSQSITYMLSVSLPLWGGEKDMEKRVRATTPLLPVTNEHFHLTQTYFIYIITP